MDLKKQAAEKAVTFIQNKSTVGLGAGSSIAYLVDFLKAEIEKGLEVTFVTSSFSTLQLLLKNKFRVQPIENTAAVDIYFDGCDQVDYQLNAVKSGGGIHTHEKLLASMAQQFVLLADEAKYVTYFDTKYPLVVELLPQSLNFVQSQLQLLFSGATTTMRSGDKKDGPVITANGNYLVDVWFETWPAIKDLNTICKTITGVVETSLFYGLAHHAIIAGSDGVKVIEARTEKL